MPKNANGMARSATMTIAIQPDILSLRVCSIGQAAPGRRRTVQPLAGVVERTRAGDHGGRAPDLPDDASGALLGPDSPCSGNAGRMERRAGVPAVRRERRTRHRAPQRMLRDARAKKTGPAFLQGPSYRMAE